MSIIKKCDSCDKIFDSGFSITVNLEGSQSFINLVNDRFEVGSKSLCRECYYKLKEIIKNSGNGG